MATKSNAKKKVKTAVRKAAAAKKTVSAKVARGRDNAVQAKKVVPRDVLGTPKRIDVNTIRAGLRVQTVGKLGETLNLPMNATLGLIGLSKQTYQRRTKEGRLKTDESDRVWRIADLIAKSTDLLGDEQMAVTWLRTPATALNGESPLERATTEIGARDVERLIGRLEHGIPA